MPVVLHPFRRKNPRVRIPETAFPDPYFFTDTEHRITKNELTLHQSPNLLEPLGGIIEMDRRLAKGPMY